jgi:intracellular septation protein
MKILYDYFPVLCFFIAFIFFGHDIILATKVIMIASFIQTIGFWLIKKRFEKMHLVTFALIMIFGGATIFFHNPEFIQIKPSIAYWLFAVILLGSQFKEKNLLQSMLEEKLSAPTKIWKILNISWALFFIFLGVANYVIYKHFSITVWTYFKFFGTLGLIVVFTVIQSIFLGKYIKEPTEIQQESENDTTNE